MTNVQIAEAETIVRVDVSGCISIYEPEEELAVFEVGVRERKEHSMTVRFWRSSMRIFE